MVITGLLGFAWLSIEPDIVSADPLTITTAQIEFFNLGSSDNQIGKLEFIGGLEITSDNEEFGGLSGLRLTESGTRLYAISDNANWFTAKITRNDRGQMTGMLDADYSCLCRATGEKYGSKHWGDSEGLEVIGNKAYVSFERLNRINENPIDKNFHAGAPKDASASFKPFKVSYNQGLEALAIAPNGTKVAGKFIAIAEESLNAKGQNRAFIADKNSIEEFAITRSNDYSVTDASFLPNGDLLILERKAGLRIGIGMRIRRLDGNAITQGAELNGEILMEAGLSSRIDNMEGISAWQTANGETRITVLSDDNFNSFQRTLLLEFKLQD